MLQDQQRPKNNKDLFFSIVLAVEKFVYSSNLDIPGEDQSTRQMYMQQDQ